MRDWVAAVAWWRPAQPAATSAVWADFIANQESPAWLDLPAPMSTTEPPEPMPVQLEHVLDKLEDGGIICATCGMRVPEPGGMPNYDGAAMGDW